MACAFFATKTTFRCAGHWGWFFYFPNFLSYQGDFHMDKADFLTAFEQGKITRFSHREHVLLGWLYLRRDGWDRGTVHIRQGIKHFALAHGASQKYHETITLFWAQMIHRAIQNAPEINDFDAFIARFPELLDGSSLSQYYSPDLLRSAAARQTWIEPDLKPLAEVFQQNTGSL
jgi:hypothetical protein